MVVLRCATWGDMEIPPRCGEGIGVIGVLAGGLLATLGRTQGGWGLRLHRLVCRLAGWSQHMARTLVLLEDGWGEWA